MAIKACINRVNGVIGVNIIFHADYDKFILWAKWDAQIAPGLSPRQLIKLVLYKGAKDLLLPD